MRLNFRSIRKFLGPTWLVGEGDGQLLGYALDSLKDATAERVRQALLIRFPQQDPTGTPAADDALAAMGRDRGIRRGFQETSANYAKRLIRWWDDKKTAGNAFALLQQLAAYTGPGPSFRTVDVRGNWYSRAADGTLSIAPTKANWDWDGANDALSRWSRFWVIVYPNGVWTTGAKWGDGSKWGDGHVWGTTMPSEVAASMRSIVADWKPAGTRCVNIVIAFDNTSFDPTQVRDGTGLPNGNWGSWGYISGGVMVPGRLSTARFIQGV